MLLPLMRTAPTSADAPARPGPCRAPDNGTSWSAARRPGGPETSRAQTSGGASARGPRGRGPGMLHARRWSWVLVLVVGIALYEVVLHGVAATGNPNFLPALILLGAAVVPAAFVTFIAGRRLQFDIGGGLVAGTALVGGVIGVVAAGVLEYRTLQRLGVLPLVAVGVIEEAAKLIVPLL